MLYDELYLYQVDAVEFVLARWGSALFLEQGTGKTRVIAGVLHRMTMPLVSSARFGRTAETSPASSCVSALLIVPLANIETTWAATLARMPELTVCRDWATFSRSYGHRVLLMHYEGLPRIVKRARKHCWDLIVYDESQRLKARATKQSKLAEKLTWVRASVNSDARVINQECRRVLLSGTPIEQDPIDLWAQFRFALPNVLPQRWATFERRWCKPTGYMGYKLKFKQEKLPAFLKLIEPHILRIHKADVLDLPKLSIVDVRVPLLGEQARIYEELEESYTTTVNGREITADLAITQLVRLQQIAGGFVKTDDGKTICVGRAKIRRLRALVAREDKPLVVFCKYSAEVRAIDLALEDYRVGILTGKTKKDQRAPLLRAFQRGEYDVLVCQVRVGGVGIDLYTAHVAIVYSTTHSFIDYDQLIARIHRHGQEHPCRILRLLAENTVDEEIYAAVSSKRKIANLTLRRHPVAKPVTQKTKSTPAPTVAAKPAVKAAATVEKPAKAAKKEAPEAVEEKPVVERPKYGVPALAEAMEIKPASVRVRLRNAGIEKTGKTYGWNTKAEMAEVIAQLKKAKDTEEKAEPTEEPEESEEEETDDVEDDEE